MQKITLLCVGKLKEPFYINAAAEYAKRLHKYCRLESLEIPEVRLPESPSPSEIQNALSKEAELLRRKLPPDAFFIALCIEGREYSSPELARILDEQAAQVGKHLVFLIGGSCGLHPSVKAQADVCLSMSRMTFPHHLARVMLLEQIYRAYQINLRTKYHK